MEDKDFYALINQGVEVWNDWRVKNYQEIPSLTGVDLSGKKLTGINFRGINLSRTDLSRTDLSGADLSGADLSGANLSKSIALRSNFEGAIFTDACIEDWNIDSATNLNNVVCDWIFLKKDKKERRPTSNTFMPGEFTKIFSRSVKVDVNLLDENIMEYVSRRASDIVLEKSRKDDAIKFRFITLLVSLFGIVGIGLITAFSNLFITQAVEEQFSKEFSELKQSFEKDIISFQDSTFLRSLSFTVRGLIGKSNPSDTEIEELRDNINRLLQKIEENPQLKQDPQFDLIITNLVTSLINNGELEILRKVDDKLQDIISSDIDLTAQMSDYFGFIMVSEIVPPKYLSQSEKDRLDTYLQKTLNGYPEEYIFWNMLINFKNNENKRNEQIDNLFLSLRRVNKTDKEFFFKKIDNNLILAKNPNERQKIINELVIKFSEVYNNELEEVKASILTEIKPSELLAN